MLSNTILYNEQVLKAATHKKNATHFMDEIHYFMCCHSAVLICIFIYFRSIFFVVVAAVIAHVHCILVWSKQYFFVFSLLLHYSFCCHFCSIYLNCKNAMQRIEKKKNICNVFKTMGCFFFWIGLIKSNFSHFMHTKNLTCDNIANDHKIFITF